MKIDSCADRALFGHMLENFVATELMKQLGWSSIRAKLHHFRTDAGQEVDVVLENPAGQIVGVEVKAAQSVDNHDLRGLKTLAEIAGQRFARGVLLYLGNTVVPFGSELWAVPLSLARS